MKKYIDLAAKTLTVNAKNTIVLSNFAVVLYTSGKDKMPSVSAFEADNGSSDELAEYTRLCDRLEKAVTEAHKYAQTNTSDATHGGVASVVTGEMFAPTMEKLTNEVLHLWYEICTMFGTRYRRGKQCAKTRILTTTQAMALFTPMVVRSGNGKNCKYYVTGHMAERLTPAIWDILAGHELQTMTETKHKPDDDKTAHESKKSDKPAKKTKKEVETDLIKANEQNTILTVDNTALKNKLNAIETALRAGESAETILATYFDKK